MKFSEHLISIDKTVEKENKEKKKKEIFDMKKETAEDLYIKSCGADEE
ncbi:MAG: hypothetical protein PUE12_02735 [Oscillospiraceae bacterium]|nr:hypothetical protein [Oscillospiraceae bacterium]